MSSKLLKAVLLGSVLMAVASPVFAQYAVPNTCNIRRSTRLDDCPAVGGTSEYDEEYCNRVPCGATADGVSGSICCLFNTIYFAVDWLFTIMMVIVVGLVLFGAYTILTAAGDPDNVNKGRKVLMFAAIGMAIALVARMVPILVNFLVIG